MAGEYSYPEIVEVTAVGKFKKNPNLPDALLSFILEQLIIQRGGLWV